MTARTSELDHAIDQLRNAKSGNLERPIGAHPLMVPLEVWIDGDRIRWRTDAKGIPSGVDPKNLPPDELDRLLGKPRQAVPGKRMLERFVHLHVLEDDAIRGFAAKWGPLGICEHGRPHTHWPLSNWDVKVRVVRQPAESPAEDGRAKPDGFVPCFRLAAMMGHTGNDQTADDLPPTNGPVAAEMLVRRSFCQPLGMVEEKGNGGWEPLERWRYYSRESAAILRSIASLHASEDGTAKISVADAHQLLYGTPSPSVSDSRDERQFVDWRWIRSAVDRWLSFGNVRPYLHEFRGGAPSVGYGTADSPIEADIYLGGSGYFVENVCGLFGALATQVLLVAVNKGGLANCTACELPYFCDRKPAAGERSFCWDPDCRKAKNKLAQRDRRARDREGASSRRRGAGRSARNA